MKYRRLLLPVLLALLPSAFGATPPLRVAFVVDDGPDPLQSQQWLRILKEAGAKVTFSYVGRAVGAHPELARAAVEAGHEVNNHSFTHPNLTKLSAADYQKELQETHALILKETGRAPGWFWAPYLATNPEINAFAQSLGTPLYPTERFHFISTDDWNTATDAASIYKRATTDVKDRTVILCHEWRKETVEQLPAILATLKARGATFLTFSELAATQP